MDATTPSLPSKTRIYETLYRLNHGFEISLLSLEQLEQLGIFAPEELRALKITLEHARAQTNEELTEALQQYESEQAVGFDQMEREREKRFKDPDDVFFAAADRKKEIREQIKTLQKGLARQKSSPKRNRKRK
jgi:dsDNA-specific endonuclease/ATPase MutS2